MPHAAGVALDVCASYTIASSTPRRGSRLETWSLAEACRRRVDRSRDAAGWVSLHRGKAYSERRAMATPSLSLQGLAGPLSVFQGRRASRNRHQGLASGLSSASLEPTAGAAAGRHGILRPIQDDTNHLARLKPSGIDDQSSRWTKHAVRPL